MSTMILQRNSLTRRVVGGLRAGCWAMSLVLVPVWGGCARLAPHPDSLPSDLQVTADSLKIAVREAQRTAAELRTELDEQRKELADAQVARAQLQGMLRETERRLAEARQVIELQREELASARIEREKVAQTFPSIPGPLLQPSGGASSQDKHTLSESDQARVGPAPDKAREQPVVSLLSSEEAIAQSSSLAPDAAPLSGRSQSAPVAGKGPEVTGQPRTIVIQAGDTLWRLARRHKVGLEALRLLNGLQNNLIVTGRTLRLPEPRLQHAAMQPVSQDILVR
jgi:LysM repeat protein